MAEVVSLSVTDGSNTQRFPEGQAANTVNDGARALEGMLARNIRDTQGYITSGGSANAYTIALNALTAAAAAGEMITFKANFTNSGAATVNVTPSGGSARGAVAIQRAGKALVGGEIITGGIYTLTHDGTQYQVDGQLGGVQLWDSNQSHKTQVVNGSNITADRTLTISPGDANRTLTISGDATVSQDYSTSGTPQFTRLGLGAAADAAAAINIASASTTFVITNVYSDASASGLNLKASHATYATHQIQANVVRAANSAYSFFKGFSGDTGDTEVNLRGDGTILSDIAATTPADYAEFFENATVGAIPVGTAIAMIDGKAVIAADNPAAPIIGIARPYGASAMVGNSHWARWSGKYVRDRWGTYLTEQVDTVTWAEIRDEIEERDVEVRAPVTIVVNGEQVPAFRISVEKERFVVSRSFQHSYEIDKVPDGVTVPDNAQHAMVDRRVLSPDYDQETEYTPRSDRPAEWTIVGLLGQVPLIKGQPTNPAWVKMWDIDSDTEMWLIR
jgi:hypothetical protein